MPIVSIGMPVYNGARLIEKAINSHLTQTFEDFEFIICDNASDDDTQEICQRYVQQDNRIKYFRNEHNIGAAANFRKVFELSSGQYYKWASVDDYCAPSYIQRCKEALDSYPEVVLACAKVYIVDGEDNILREYEDAQALCQPTPFERFKSFLDQDPWVNVVYGLMRANVLRETSVLGSYPGSDIVVMAEMALRGHFWEVPERLFFRRIHPDAYSYANSIEKQQEFYTPGETNKLLPMYHWRHLFEYTRAVFRTPLAYKERARLLGHIARMSLWSRRKLAEELRDVFRKPA